ncbi:CO2 hydration protein [Chamaesiphon sp. VAR_48_metabat_403]|uniref:CO2 hydration protein n=1 Tax=Chamaesiphon sp. VAR_48_metabat_403 TaxID=2964700 RepID=UPI00286D9B14|nr:CO2 hydration protein [Chamaesiphon sp. VAR_48_metabat_403]
MTSINSCHRFAAYIDRFYNGQALVPDTPHNVKEVVGILDSYGYVLNEYQINLQHISKAEFLTVFPFFKYFNNKVSIDQIVKHWWHDRINFEYAEYCMKVMLWHGGGKLEQYIESPEFRELIEPAIQAKIKGHPIIQLLHRFFPEFLPEQVRQMVYYNALGQFWEVMCEIFLTLGQAYNKGKITTIPQVVEWIKAGLVAAAGNPIHYAVEINGRSYDILPPSAQLTFLMDVAVPYVEAIFFRGTPFLGVVSFNAQAHQIPVPQEEFTYGALYADPLPIGGSGIPPTLLMQDMRHYIPPYLHEIYQNTKRKEDDLLVKICQSFQKSMYCVTSATILGLAPHPLDSQDPREQSVNMAYFEGWMDRLLTSQLPNIQG